MKVLLVEDDLFVSELLVEVLSSQDFIVDVAIDGQAGWDLVETSEYNLLLLDVMLPKVNGISLCRRLRDHGHKMPVLMLTARDTIQDRLAGMAAGANGYLVKPYKLRELFANIQALAPLAQSVDTGGETSLHT